MESSADSSDGTFILDWYPLYGCVICCQPFDEFLYQLTLLGPDQWELDGRYLPGSRTAQTAAALGVLSLSLGYVKKVNLKGACEKFKKLFQESSQKTGSERSAAKGQGHQQTPSFICALWEQCLTNVDTKENSAQLNPRGGTTDVGKHTGCHRRETSWHLDQCLLIFYLGQSLSDKWILHLDLFVAQYMVTQLESAKEPTRAQVQRIFEVMDKCASKTYQQMAKYGCSAEVVTIRMETHRSTVDHLFESYASQVAKK